MINKYTDFSINKDNNTFYIVESCSKPKTYDSALETLKKIEFIVQNKLSYDQTHQDGYSKLSKEELYGALEEKSVLILENYKKKLNNEEPNIFSREWLIRKLFGKEKQITEIFTRLQNRFEPPPVFHIPNEIIQQISEYLELHNLGALSQANRHGNTEATNTVINRAKKYGYEGNDYIEASNYIDEFLLHIKIVLKERNLQHRYIIYRGKTIDIEITLHDLKPKISTEDIFNILSNKSIYTAPFDNIRKIFDVRENFKIKRNVMDFSLEFKGEYALTLAASYGNNEGAKLLLQHGVNPNSEDYYPLHLAVQHGHIDVAETLLKHKVYVDTLFGDETPLLHACYKSKAPLLEQTKMVDFLLQNGANPNSSTSFFSEITPLHYAANNGNANIVKLLLDHNAKTNHRNYDGETALLLASGSDPNGKPNAKVVKLLLKHGAYPNIPDNNGFTPLYYAIQGGLVDIAELLLENGANLEINPKFSALSVACGGRGVKYSAKIVELLLQHGANPNSVDQEGYTPLYYAICQNRADIVELLLDNGAEVDITLRGGQTALLHACGSTGLPPNPKIIKLLLQYEPNLNHSDQDGLTVLHRAALNNDINTLKVLLNHKVKLNKSHPLEVNKKTNKGNTALHIAFAVAASKPNPEIVKLLLQHGADPKIKNKKGENVLTIAKEYNDIEVMAYLLKYGAEFLKSNISSKDIFNILSDEKIYASHFDNFRKFFNIRENFKVSKTGNAEKAMLALILAINHENKDIIELLLQHRVNPNFTDQKGYSPLYYAIKAGRMDITELLLKKGAKLNRITSQNSSSLEIACGGEGVKYSAGMVELLLQHGENPNVVGQKGYTPLHHATDENRADIVELLLDYGANPNLKDEQGKTPLAIAQEQDNIDIITTLLQYNGHA